MNKYLMQIFHVLILISAFVATAFAGGYSGGGDAAVSSPEQVTTAISSVKPKLTEWLKVSQIHFKNLQSGAAISEFYNDFYMAKPETTQAISIWSVANSPFVIKTNGPCLDMKGNPKDAAVLERLEPGSPICLSIPRLTRIPSDQLERQLVALVAHELTHQILKTLDEEWPLKMQIDVLDTYAWATETNAVCYVHTFKDNKGEVTGYQIYLGFLLDCTGGCAYAYSFGKDELSKYLEITRRKHIDPIGREVGCATFEFR